MLILLPPSEGKAAPRRGSSLDLGTLSFGSLTQPRRQVLDALVALCAEQPDRAAQVLGLGVSQADELARNAGLLSAPTARADRIYTGVLYEALDLAGLDSAARRRAARWLAVTSSVFGLVRTGDRIPAYRLAGGVALPGLGGIAAHWRSHLDAPVAEAAGSGLVVDLRSSTYAAFWRPDGQLAPRTVAVRVLHEQDGRRSVVSHFNKATKGRLVASLLRAEGAASLTRPGALATLLRDLGWQVEETVSGRYGQPSFDVVVREL